MRGRKPKDRKKNTQWSSVPPAEVSVPLGYEFLSARQNTTSIEIKVRPQLEPDRCFICGAELEKYGTRTPSFRDVNQSERTCVLIVQRHHYMCKGLVRHFPGQPLPGIDTKHDMTFRLVQFIRNNPDLTNVKLAGSVGVSDKTVARIHWDHAVIIEQRQKAFDIYLALGFDEKRINGVDYFVLVDLVTRTYITMIEGNDPGTIRKELEQYAHRDRVGLITIDMHNDYSDLARELFANASVIYDAFHVLDMLDECRETVRTNAWRLAKGEAKAILHDRKHFWERVNDPSSWGGEQSDLFNDVPSIMEAHNTYKALLYLWHSARSPREASRLFDLWVEHIPIGVSRFFQPFILAVEKRRDDVFLYFATGATAGPTEAVNRNIQAELAKGRGYTDEGLAARMKVKAEVKRQQQTDAMKSEGDTDEDIRNQRELQLSTDGSLARSKKMRMQIAIARSTTSASWSDALKDGHEQLDVATAEPKAPTSANIAAPDDSTNYDNVGGSASLMSMPALSDASTPERCLSCSAWDPSARQCIDSSFNCCPTP
jgi:hypothetical protein